MATVDLSGGTAAAVPFQAKYFKTKPLTVALLPTIANADVLKTVPLKKGWLVLGYIAKSIVASTAGTSLVATVGITGQSAVGFDASLNLKAAAGVVTTTTPADVYGATGGYYITADTTLDLVPTLVGVIGASPGTIEISVYGIDLN